MLKLKTHHFFLFSLILCPIFFQPSVAQVVEENTPQDGVYPGRCAERVGSSVLHETYFRFTCNGVEDGFSLNNYGPNRIVPPHAQDNDLYPARDFYFNFPGRHRQEMHLLLVDWPSENGPDVRISKLYFFPRLILPSIKRISSEQYEVTLPNLERILFQPETKEIISSAFRESPMNLKEYAQNPKFFAGVSYHGHLAGETVLVRVDRRGPASFLNGTATVTKQCGGILCGKCEVPSAEIFTDTSSEFRFADDLSFKTYLQAKCGFGC